MTGVPTTRAGRRAKVRRLVAGRVGCLVPLVLVASLVAGARAADPEKAITLKDDELAVLADARSPDRKEVCEKYNGKLLKFTGRVTFHDATTGRVPGGGSSEHFSIRVAGKTAKDPVLNLRVAWSQDPSTEAIQKQVKRAGERGVAGVTVYGIALFKFRDGPDEVVFPRGLTDAATDPKVAGVPFTPKEKEPARLKPDKK
jgi:hypothetical protein